ncbi:hypothetical protein FFLO_00474 [Filobasidium floriforme]|uniref:Uncharacterized protein n=1 Tax=Filobasidium floriforme TaxID=5210 RepID=A0A8K0JRH8_9TREE|nr:uncharacterized protein HD553DRAFT_345765 [Filobasidium floriforme]KAG7575310.1 hypothetical protein FFLO_00474 [Filobasidium floriforme]KAH8078897.1 hypothetical protein HD553DRAFT_345765 [Filobasidium floriforme]
MSSIRLTDAPAESMSHNANATEPTNGAASTRSASVASTNSIRSVTPSEANAEVGTSQDSSQGGGDLPRNPVEAALTENGYFECGWDKVPFGLQVVVAESADPITAARNQMMTPVSGKVSKGAHETVDALDQKLSLDSRVIVLGAGMAYVRRDTADFILVAATAPGAVYLMYLNKSISKHAYTVFKKGLLDDSSPDDMDLHVALEILRAACDASQTEA